jgi:antiviral helicase SKI2
MDERISPQLPWELLDLFPEDSQQLLTSLGLDSVPSGDQTYREIEERLLLPKETLPEDWLSKYQVWVHIATLLAH